MASWNLHHLRCHELLPAPDYVVHEQEDGSSVEERSGNILEEFDLESVGVPDFAANRSKGAIIS
eukprot:1310845-Karenia_brevis.AAC.1